MSQPEQRNDGRFIWGVLIGAVIGAVVAALYVPRGSLETREPVAERNLELTARPAAAVRKAEAVAETVVAKLQAPLNEALSTES